MKVENVQSCFQEQLICLYSTKYLAIFTKQLMYKSTIKYVLQRQRKKKTDFHFISSFSKLWVEVFPLVQSVLHWENNSFLSDIQLLHLHSLMSLLLVCVSSFLLYSGVRKPLLVASVCISYLGIPLNQNVMSFYSSISYPGLFIHGWFSLHRT